MMKNMKLTCLLLALLMVVSMALAGCGEDGSDDIGGDVKPLESTSGKTDDIGGDVDPLETNPEESTPDSNPVGLGRMEGGIYTNTYAGLGCELDESWTFYSAEELQQLPDNIGELLEGTEVGDAVSGMEQIMDMQAECTDDLTTMNMVLQKLSLADRLRYAKMSEEEIVDETLSQSDILKDGYAQAGIMVQSMEKKTVTFLGEEHVALYTVADIEGIAYYILQLLDFDQGAYSITLTLGSYVEDKTDSLLDLFYAIED